MIQGNFPSYAAPFDQLDHEQEYDEIQPVIHIGFLDYTLFNESPEFYATYKLINV